MEILSSAPHTLHLFAEYACAAIEFISIIIILCGVTISNPDLQGVIVLTVIVLLRVVLSFTLSREVAEMDRREREAEGRAPSDEKHDADAPR